MLEPRILFDGAAAVAAEHQDNSQPDGTSDHSDAADQTHPEPATTGPPSSGNHLLVIDGRIDNLSELTENLGANVSVLIVDGNTNGLDAISAALDEIGEVESIQILTHGASGQFVLGNSEIRAQTIDALSDSLSDWRDHLSEDADIQLYGCNIGAGSSGQALVSRLADLTGADVAASDDETGASSLGGDWDLETQVGVIDKATALNAEVIAGFDSLLADADPLVSVGSGSDVLLGDQFTFTVNFENNSSQVGFAPYLDLFFPATGKDGAGAETDDGVTFISAKYLDQTLTAHTVTFDADGNATHPIAKDSNGDAVVINAATYGLQAGDQLVVVQLPFASVTEEQPTISLDITAALSNLADTAQSNGSPDLTIKVRGGFEFGNDALDNPTTDPSLIEAITHDFVVHPTIISISQSVNAPEGEVTTGPNYVHSLTLTATPATGQTLTNVVVTQPIPDQIQVTSITPGSGGTITSVTLYNGTVLTNSTLIDQAISSDSIFIKEFTVEYDSISAAIDTVVEFYVPEADSDGALVLDPTTGDDVTITVDGPTGSGNWVPLDERDLDEDSENIEFTGTGASASFVAKSITVEKSATVAIDNGQSGLTPGDTLRYTLDLAISDYFAFGEDFFENGSFIITDTLSDGQTLSSSPAATFTYSMNGVTQTIDMTGATTTTPNGDGTTDISLDIAQALRNSGLTLGALIGDLAFDETQAGATLGVISYSAVLSQNYTSGTTPKNAINEGDAISNSASITATILQDALNLTGSSETDDSSTSHTLAHRSIDITISDVNGSTPPSNVELNPGDVVTFTLNYDLLTGDYEDFVLTAYLPLPLFDVSGIAWSQGSGADTWNFGGDNTNAGSAPTVTSIAGNAIQFDFGDFDTSSTDGSTIEVQFTITVGDQPYADQRSINVLAESSQSTTLTAQTLVSSDVAQISSIAEPVLTMSHGVVSSSNGTVSGTTGTWNAPGTSGTPFSGNVNDITAIEGSVTDIDGGDLLRLATAIENTGGGGAFDVATSITLPTGLSFANGTLTDANLQIYRGDGTLLVLGTDYSVSGNTITFLDNGGVATLLAGRDGTSADTSGANLVVITYDVEVNDAIDASATLQTTATLGNYASVDGGTDFTPTDLEDIADQQVAAPEIRKNFADGSLDNSDSSASHTTGSDLVVGESMLYDIIVTLPEGTTQSLEIDDLVPDGMSLDTSFNGTGYQLITLTSESGALTNDFAGSITVSSLTAVSGTLGDDGVDGRFSFSASSAAADNDTGNNSFVIRVRLVAENVTANQASTTRQNSAELHYSDPDGDTANGSTPQDRTVALSDGKPSITLREPTLTIDQTLVTSTTLGFDQGDEVEFTITITNGNSGTDFDAFDISLASTLPTELDGLTIAGITYSGGATNNSGADFEIAGGVLQTSAGANVDIVKGGSIVIRITGTVNATAASEANFSNTAEVRWTSLDGASAGTADPAGERTGQDGSLGGGALNDYRRSDTLTIPVAQAILVSRVGGLPDTEAPDPTDASNETVVVGEIIRYRVVVLLPEGANPNYQLEVTLDNGLEFIDKNDNAMLVGFISNGGLTTDATLITGGTLEISGNQDSAEAQSIDPNLAGAAPTGVLDPTQVNIAGQVITFNFGNISNSEVDSDREGIVLEFNVRVANVAASSAGAALGMQVQEIRNGTNGAQSDTFTETVVEPSFSSVDKTVTDFDPNPTGSTGTATVELSFTQDGGAPAFNTNVSDDITGGTNYELISIKINDTTYTVGNLPSGISFDQTSGISVDFDQLNVDDAVVVTYSVDVPNNTTIAATDASLTWSSLPEDFTGWGGNDVGTDGDSDGERTGSGVGENDYVLTEGAGLGVISGTLWNDTATASADGANVVPDGGATGLEGLTVTLTWAGADGDLATTADNLVFTTETDANGEYSFGVLPSGNYRIDTPTDTVTYAQPVGDLEVRIDTDGTGGTLGQVDITLGEGTSDTADAGYVEQNDAPVNTLPGNQSVNEDTPLTISGLSIDDIDSGRGGDTQLTVQLTVLHGTVSVTLAGAASISSGSNNSSTLTLQGTRDDINATLANGVIYQGTQDYNGTDTLTVTTSDRGNYGDADDDGIPGETSDDALTDTDSLQITINAINDDPVANNDTATAQEAGGNDNLTPGVDPRGSLIDNDTDVDIATNDDELRITDVTSIATSDTETISSGGSATITGQYGSLVVQSDGRYQYVVDNDNADVQALRLSGNTLSETFSYTLSDLGDVTDTATFTVTITGANDAPIGVDDTGSATEAGGVANGTAGTDASGNVLTNDTDVDANSETKVVSGVRAVPKDESGALTTVSGSTPITGTYGTLTINPDGSYSYVIDNSNADVQGLSAGDTLTEVFSYQVTDAAGLNDLANLTITINGANDNPVATNNVAVAQAANSSLGDTDAAESNPNGNVITNDTGDGADSDVDSADQPNTNLRVSGINSENLNAAGALTSISSGATEVAVTGEYGTLYISSDGTARYNVDSENTDVIALGSGVTADEVFTYEITDTNGLTTTATITITVYGANDDPVAQDAFAIAQESGGVDNATAGSNPTGDVTSRDVDPDGDPLTVVAIRTGPSSGGGTSGTIGVALAGTYGSLTLNSDGTYSYVVDNTNTAVEALRNTTHTVTERFTYTIQDGGGLQDTAEIVIVIRGQNDAPVAVDDSATAVEAGGESNNSPGTDPSGNVLTNDTDVDSTANGETKEVSAVRTGAEAASGTSGTLGSELRGSYGWLTINEDGSYSYRLDNSNATVQALRNSGNTLSDTFTYTVSDKAGATDNAAITITIQGANDTPTASNDTAIAVEAGGTNNGTAGTNPTGNVLTNDSDIDQNGESLSVSAIRQGTTIGTVGSGLAGTYGTLTLNSNGSYSYVVDNTNAAVQALLSATQTLTETFTYTTRDLAGATSTATLTVTIQGANDAPVAVNDTATATEAGGTNNGTAGTNPTGNLLTNDTDVDSSDTKSVSGIRTGSESAGGSILSISGSRTVTGTYGTLTIAANGTFTYAVNNSLAAVQALKVGDSLSESFTYRLSDSSGATDLAEIAITINGAWDAPVAVNNFAYAVAENAENTANNPEGNVLTNDTDVDSGDSKYVNGARTGSESAGGALDAVASNTSKDDGTVIVGTYGTLTIGADGTYRFVVDSTNPDLINLPAQGTRTEIFTYQVVDDGGQTDTAQLTVIIRGRNDAPVAVDDTNTASDQVQAPHATGNVIPNDTDTDDVNSLEVTAIRTGAEDGTGTEGALGASIQGKYGTLTLNADGSYSYSIDLNNPEVLAAAGLGTVLKDEFTYTLSDDWGATDQATLTINLDIAAPYVPIPDGNGPRGGNVPGDFVVTQPPPPPLPDVRPIVFVTPTVQVDARVNEAVNSQNNGSDIFAGLTPFIRSQSIGSGLGEISGQFVGSAVDRSSFDSDIDLAVFLGRQGRVDLNAEGLLSDPSLFTPTSEGMTEPGGITARAPETGEFKTASSFSNQLQNAVNQVPPIAARNGSADKNATHSGA
ncbi:VCBS domain-containing protein [Thalassospira xianhensis]|uniref:VCBS domain-containing protein n=1 Tax=Thalassospira xianhensis TaxID=478503 RepID=UPI001ABF2DC6|nr:VCBS domain-containing protein [Thalassospira xianhensis]